MAVTCPKCRLSNPDTSHYCADCGTSLATSKDIHPEATELFKTSARELTTGSTFAGRYQIIEELGKGGMGLVYKARDTRLKRTIALKLLHKELTGDPEYNERFIQEAQAASMLDHPNICTIYEIDETDEGQMYIVMAFYEGETLRKKLEGDQLTQEMVLDIGLQIVHGLTRAHAQHIVHRDIKPANLMITNDGVLKILDFGLAKLIGQTKLTKTATIMGTVSYMSPEQALAKETDHRTDIWSTGIVLYEMVTSQMPFGGDNEQAVIYSILNKTPIPPRDIREEISVDFETIILNCLRKEVGDRYSSAQHLLVDLINLKTAIAGKKGGKTAERRVKDESKRETERRQATVLAVEILGYAEMVRTLDEEETALIMSRYFEICNLIEEKFECQIQKISNTTLQALFGISPALEEAPKNAINAAIELRNQLYQFNQKESLKVPLDGRFGINTGTVIVSSTGSGQKKDYFVMGEAVEHAHAFRDQAAPGQIIVGPATQKYSQREFRYSPLKPVSLKGKEDVVRVYELLSVKEKIHRPKLGTERVIESEMVGRVKELDKLEFHLLKAIKGEGSIVSVVGEAGIGKSRLITEFKRNEAIRKAGLLQGRAISIGRNLSFYPIIDIIKNWAQIEEEDDPTESHYKLEKAIFGIDPEKATEIFPFIATLMGMKLAGNYAERLKRIEGEALQKLILLNLRKLIEKAATRRPLVFILEDLHWADLSSLDLLKLLFRLVETSPILFINVFRPGYEDTTDRLMQTIRARYGDFHSEIYLDSLDENETELIIRNLLKISGFPARIKETIMQRAGGNPFFIEEVMRSLIDQEMVELVDGQFKISDRIDSFVIPETIQDVIMGRIDKLDEATRSLLKVASVIGRNFFYRILADVVRSIDDIDERLNYLKNVQLILERKRTAELEYLFKHALAQEATYESIPYKKRKEWHLIIADSIQSLFSEKRHEFYGMLAYHYGKAEDLDKAEEYLIKAGEEALKSSASSEALKHYQEALNIYLNKCGRAVDPVKITILKKNIALAHYNRGQYQEAVDMIDMILPYLGESVPRRTAAVARKFLAGFLHFLISVYIPALKWKKNPRPSDIEIINLSYKKLMALGHLDPKRVFIESFYLLKILSKFDLRKIDNGVGMFAGGSLAFAWTGMSFKLSKKILNFAKEQLDFSDLKSVVLYETDKVTHNFLAGEWENVKYDENLFNQGMKIAEIFSTSNYTIFHGRMALEQGFFQETQELIDRLSHISETFEHDYPRALKHFLRAKLLTKYRKISDALKEVEEGIAFNKKTGLGTLLFGLHAFKARLRMMMGDYQEARSILEETWRLKSELNVTPCYLNELLLAQFLFDLHQVRLILRNKNKKGQKNVQKRALKIGKKLIKKSHKAASDCTEAYKLMGLYYWMLGKQKKAVKLWHTTMKEGEKLGARLELSRAYLEIGKCLQEPQSKFRMIERMSAEELIRKAHVMFREVGLQPDLEEMGSI